MKRTIPLYPGAWPQCVATAIAAIRELEPRKAMLVTISERKRTGGQNDRWHAMAGELAEELGYTPDELKRLPTVDELMEQQGMSQATAYRWVERFRQARGVA